MAAQDSNQRGKQVPLDSESEPKYTPEEAQDIYQRAAEIHAGTLFQDEKLSEDQIEANAERVGIDERLIDQAIHEREEEQHRAEAARRAAAEQARLIAAQRAQWLQRAAVVGGLFVLLCGVSVWRTQAQLSAARAAVEASQSQVENVLERRHELVPSLIRVTKSSLEQQQALVQSLNQATQQAKAADAAGRTAAEAKLDAAIQNTLEKLGSEAGSSPVVLRLTDEMAGAANRISVERMRYNQSVEKYNRLAGTFPANRVGPMLGFPPRYEFFRASEASKRAPEF